MSFHEKSAWACLVAIVVVYVPYFLVVWLQPLAFIGLFWLAAIVLAGLLTAFHTVNALATRSIRTSGDTPPLDELDRLIELRASKLAGIVLGAVVMLWTLAAMFGALGVGLGQLAQANITDAAELPRASAISLLWALSAIHALFAGFVVANVAYYGAIVAGYRRLARA